MNGCMQHKCKTCYNTKTTHKTNLTELMKAQNFDRTKKQQTYTNPTKLRKAQNLDRTKQKTKTNKTNRRNYGQVDRTSQNSILSFVLFFCVLLFCQGSVPSVVSSVLFCLFWFCQGSVSSVVPPVFFCFVFCNTLYIFSYIHSFRQGFAQ